MALVIDKTIDLTAWDSNPEPKLVAQLSIIHEAYDGELVQYYIRNDNLTQGDKNTYAIGVYDEDSRSYSYTEYDDIVWSKQGQRICGNRIERLGVKAFPAVGAIAFYKMKNRKITRIVAPVNRRKEKSAPPILSATINADGTVTFRINAPDEPEYECYRIVLESGLYAEEYITYEPEITVAKPRVTGEYMCRAIGYGEEGQMLSKDSNVITLNLTGKADTFQQPYYLPSHVDSIAKLTEQYQSLLSNSAAMEARLTAQIQALEAKIPVVPDPGEGEENNG